MGRKRKVTPQKEALQPSVTDWRPVFLEALRECGMVKKACQIAGISRMEAYRTRKEEPAFALEWEAAKVEAVQTLEDEAWRRAVDGNERNIYTRGGELLDTVKEYSDTLLIFLLKANNPAKYRETIRQEWSGKDGGPIELILKWDNERDV